MPDLDELRAVCHRDVLTTREEAIRHRDNVKNDVNYFAWMHQVPAQKRKQMIRGFFKT